MDQTTGIVDVAVYARKSQEESGKDADAKSCVRQVEHARAFAAERGWRVAAEHVFSDDGISGAEFDKRPGLVALLARVPKRGAAPFQALVVSEVSRLGREQFQTGWVLGQLARAGVRIFTYLDGKEASFDATGKFMLAVGTFADEMERDRARTRTRDALVAKARAGHVAGGRLFGYDNVREGSHTSRRVNPEEAAVVARIFEAVAAGTGLRRLAHQLNADRVAAPRPSKSGPRGWCSGTIRAIVERTAYKGTVTYNRHAKVSATGVKRSGVRKPESAWVVVDAPSMRVVSDELWQAAQARLAATRSTYLRATEAVTCRDGKARGGLLLGRPRFGGDAKWMLVGLAECGACGGGLQTRARFEGGRKVMYYECTTRRQRGLAVCSNRLQVRVDAADRAVLSLVEAQLFSPEVVARVVAGIAERLRATGAEASSRLASLSDASRRLEAQQARLVDAIADGGESRALRAKLADVEREHAAVADDLRRLAALAHLRGRDLAALEAAAQRTVARDWAGLLARHPLQARAIVKKFVRGRFVFTPVVGSGKARYEVAATASTDLILAAAVPALAVPPPRGPEGGEPGRWWPQGDFADVAPAVRLSLTLPAAA